jgi:amino acid transporter
MSIALLVIIGINFLGTRAFGECEFWFASIKIICIVGLIILSFAIDVGAGDQGVLGFRSVTPCISLLRRRL